MSRLLCQPELLRRPNQPGPVAADSGTGPRAPIRNRTVDLLLTMETLYRLSYWGVLAPASHDRLHGTRVGRKIGNRTARGAGWGRAKVGG
jgi:hypothetical protein